jgi:hypothetical protein
MWTYRRKGSRMDGGEEALSWKCRNNFFCVGMDIITALFFLDRAKKILLLIWGGLY